MITNIDIDEELIAEAMKLSGARTKREAVDRALREMVARSRRPRIKDLWGIAKDGGFFEDYDPKAPPEEFGRYRVEQPVPPYQVKEPSSTLPVAKPPRSRKTPGKA